MIVACCGNTDSVAVLVGSGNYYNQQVLEHVYNNIASLASTSALDFPNAIYIDGIDTQGAVHTGVSHPCGTGAECSTSLPVPSPTGSLYANASYAYSATLVGANYKRFCRDVFVASQESAKLGLQTTVCKSGLDTVELLRARQPMLLWDDPVHGRMSVPPKSWP